MKKSVLFVMLCLAMIFYMSCASSQKRQYEQINEYLRNGQIEKAVIECEKLEQKASNDAELLYEIAHLYHQLELYEKEIPLLARIESIKPSYRSTDFLLVKAYMKTKKLNGGFNNLPAGVDTSNHNLIYLIGRELHNNGEFENARDYLVYVKNEKDYDDAAKYLARIYCASGNYGSAIANLKKYIGRDIRKYERIDLALIYEAVDSTNKRDAIFSEMLTLADTFSTDPKRINHYLKGVIHYMGKDYEAALKEWRLHKQAFIDRAITFHNIAILYLAMGDCENWFDEYHLASLAASSYKDSIICVIDGYMHLAREDYLNALKHFLIAQREHPESGICNGLVAYTLEKLDHYDDAERYWNLAILKVPGGASKQGVREFVDILANEGVTCMRQRLKNPEH